MNKRSTIVKNWPKFLLQWGVLAALVLFITGLVKSAEAVDPEAYCPMGGFQALATFLANGTLPCSMSSVQVMMAVALLAAVVLFSKLFCAFLCPIGSIEDLLIKARKPLHIKPINIKDGSIADKALRIIKFVLLFYIVYMTVEASELFCKKLDPYYAVATGFKGEIVLVLSIISVLIVLLPGLFINRFWCKYICPLGAISNTFKYWAWALGLGIVWWLISLTGANLPWWICLAIFSIMGYLLEILCSKPKYQALSIVKDESACSHCGLCTKACPFAIQVGKAEGGRVNCVDCTLCGECVASCPTQALTVGTCKNAKPNGFRRFLPAILAVLIALIGFVAGRSFELPTIDESWDIEEGVTYETVTINNLKSVKCYGSSMAFKARMEGVRGVHGVKTFVGSHTVVIKYDPSKTNAENIQEEVFVPSHFRVWSPDPKKISEIYVRTIRTEQMYDKLDLNYLGLQFRETGKSIFGVDSEYDCPLIVHIYMSKAEADTLSEDWFRQIVEKKALEMPVHGGGTKATPVDFKFVKLEKEVSKLGIAEYLESMFDPFSAEYSGRYEENGETVVKKRVDVYKDAPQFIYEVCDQNYEKPIIKRALPYLSNHLSKEEGVIGTYLRLNKELVPSIQVRFAAPMTAERVRELMDMDTWTITYATDDVREEPARMSFKQEGTSYPYETPSE